MKSQNGPVIYEAYGIILLLRSSGKIKPMKTFGFHSEKLDDIVFENRNKEYGAYELRKSHDSRLLKSFMFALLLISTSVAIPVIVYHLLKKNKTDKPLYAVTMVDMTKKFSVEQNKKIEVLSSPSSNLANADVPFHVTADSLIAHEDNHPDTMLRSTESVVALGTGRGNDSSAVASSDTTSSTGNSGTAIAGPVASTAPFDLAAVDKAPEFQGGTPALMSFL